MAPPRKKLGTKKVASRPRAKARVTAKPKTKVKAATAKKPVPSKVKVKPAAVARRPAAKKPAAAKKAVPAKVSSPPKRPAGPPAGKVVWHELYTTDVKAARAFYTALFDWTIRDVPMGCDTYALTFNGPRDVAGIMPGSPGQPSYWLGYIEVPNVDDAVDAIEAEGGRVFLPQMDLPGVGRFAVAADLEGAMFAPFSSAPKKTAAKPDGPPAGSFLWDELIVSNSTRAKTFYGKVIGWGTRPMDGQNPGAYDLFTRGGSDFAGLLAKGDKVLPSCWMTYIGVANVDKAAARAQKLGATIMKAPFDIPGVGRIAVLRDPTGAALGIYKPSK